MADWKPSGWFVRSENHQAGTVSGDIQRLRRPLEFAAARAAGTRIPVWQLVAARETGASEGQLLMDFPRLEARNLVDAWAYAADHPEEIRAQIHANEVA